MNRLQSISPEFRQSLARGEISLGSFLVSGSSYMAEAMANHAIDWLLIDMEASHASKEDVLHVLQALNAYPAVPVVRVISHDKHQIESCLDMGALGIMIPKVDTAQQAREVTASCYYPPQGSRGMNCIRASAYYTRAKHYFEQANASIFTVIQVESPLAVENAGEMARVPTVDCLFLGLGDLAAALGQNGVVTGPRMDEARSHVLEACRAHGKTPGIFAHSVEAGNQYIQEGFRFVAIGNEMKFMSIGLSYCISKVSRKGVTRVDAPAALPGENADGSSGR